MDIEALLKQYAEGPALLRREVAGMTDAQMRARPIPGKWSTLELICHLADCEGLYAERMRRVIADDEPALPAMDPDGWMARLAIDRRDAEEELKLIEAIRAQMVRVLRAMPAAAFERTGVHSADGRLTLATLLKRIANHIPHHAKFIAEKRAAQAS